MKRINQGSVLTDERFIAQLGIISIQNRIDTNSPLNHRWVSRFKVGETNYHIEGFAADFGRPRGIDTDVQLAVETLFMLQGCPGNNTVDTTAYVLLQMCHMTTKGTNYVRLRESLMRLWRVGFLISQARYSPQSLWYTYINETLGLFQRVRFWSQGSREDGPELSTLMGDGKLLIQLSEPLADSIRAGYTQSLDRKLLSQIEQPAGRATYRILQAHRPAEGEPLVVGLMDWATACGVLTDQPDKIRRTLEAAHEELAANSYLDEVVFEGRGSKQQITYYFRAEDAADPALVNLLIEQAIPRIRAEELAIKYADNVENAIRYVKQRRLEGKVKSPGGLTTDILQHPEKYQLDLGGIPSDTEKTTRIQIDLKAEEKKAEEAHQQKQEVLLALTPQQQWEECRSTLKLLLNRLVTAEQWKLLEEKCLAGEIEAASLTRELTSLTAKGTRLERLNEYLTE